MVAVAKAVTSVAELELPHVDSESTTSEIHRYHPEEEYEETLPERTVGAECSHAVAKLLHGHKDIFPL